jgi:hypothetical protein
VFVNLGNTTKSVLKKLKISDSSLPFKGSGRPKKLLRGQGDTLKDSLERTHDSNGFEYWPAQSFKCPHSVFIEKKAFKDEVIFLASI